MNSRPPQISGCNILLHWEGVFKVDFNLLLLQLRHIGQVAEVLLDGALAREELVRPPGLVPHGGHGDLLTRATHHCVRGVHGNVPRILFRNSKALRDCGHVFVAEPVVSILLSRTAGRTIRLHVR